MPQDCAYLKVSENSSEDDIKIALTEMLSEHDEACVRLMAKDDKGSTLNALKLIAYETGDDLDIFTRVRREKERPSILVTRRGGQ